jgi:ligand-binding sensor domain-containing protein
VSLLLVANVADAKTKFEVLSVLGSTSDVYAVLEQGERTLVASSGGVIVLEGGTIVKTITSADGLLGSRARSLSAVTEGVWVGGVDGLTLLAQDLTIVKTVKLRRVQRVVNFGSHSWFATYGKGLYRSAGDGAPKPISAGRWRTRLTDMVVVNGELWVSSAGAGIARLNQNGKIVGTFSRVGGLASDMVWDLAVDGDRVFVGTAAGISMIKGVKVLTVAPVARASKKLPVRDVRSVSVDAKHIYLATYGAGAFRIRRGASTPVKVAGAGSANSRAILSSASGVWLAHQRGLHRSIERRRLRPVLSGGLPSGDITSMTKAFGKVWIGTFSGGLAALKGKKVSTVEGASRRWGLDGRINDLATTLESSGKQRLWIATDRGLWSFDGRRFDRADAEGAPGKVHVTALHVDNKGALWVASTRTLSRRQHGQWTAWTGDKDVPILQLHSVTTDARGTVWVGSLHGLLEFRPSTGTFRHHTVASGALPVDWVTSVVPYGGGIVAGTYHGGLSFYDGTAFTIVSEGKDGLPAGWVNPHAISVVNSRLWVGTLDRGLVVGTAGAWRHLTISDGLPSDDVTAVLKHGSETLVATRAGLARVTSSL